MMIILLNVHFPFSGVEVLAKLLNDRVQAVREHILKEKAAKAQRLLT